METVFTNGVAPANGVLATVPVLPPVALTPQAKAAVKKALAFHAAPGKRISDEDAQLAGEELERMRIEGTAWTPQAIVERAKSPSSPLHKFFTWDDTEAAEKWRRSQARRLVQSIRITVRDAGGRPRDVNAHISVQVKKAASQNDREYRSVAEVKADPGARKQVLSSALRELRWWREKNAALGLVELQPVFEAIDNFKL